MQSLALCYKHFLLYWEFSHRDTELEKGFFLSKPKMKTEEMILKVLNLEKISFY